MMRKFLVLAFVLSIALGSLAVLGAVKAQSTVDITLYGGPVSSGASGTYGFGYTADNITSPGPTLTLHDGDVVTVTLHNTDTALTHSFQVCSANSDTATVFFDSAINPGTYVAPGGTGTVTFTVSDHTGNYYYICPVPGHNDLGMYGVCNIEAAIPEFPLALTSIFAVLAATGLVVFLARSKVKTVKVP
jgi:FtsP/CotA-like multicopper oxidase with cupredoxin domain